MMPNPPITTRSWERNAQTVDWNSSEHMKDVGPQYRLGVVIEHNTAPVMVGAGSCIFMHIWHDKDTGTTGCTAMSNENIDPVVKWLDPAANPVLVQLPQPVYKTVKTPWQLP